MSAAGETSLFETKLRVENKDIFVDVKKNDNGIYLKIAERNRNNRSTILMPASGIEALRDSLTAALANIGTVDTSDSRAKKRGGSSAAADGAAKVADERKVFVNSLPYELTADQLKAWLDAQQLGSYEHVEILVRKNGRSLGCATVEFSSAAGAREAIARGNGLDLGGRTVVIREFYNDN
jgi:hypothetical protein